jgi:hypothetical protein
MGEKSKNRDKQGDAYEALLVLLDKKKRELSSLIRKFRQWVSMDMAGMPTTKRAESKLVSIIGAATK